MENWAYGFSLNHEGAGVGTIYYSKKYFEREGIVNPASAQPYTIEEIDKVIFNLWSDEDVIIYEQNIR